jgi:hypothetical protein
VIKSFKLPSKKAFRVKGNIDAVKFEKLSTYPVGDGEFILAINGTMRKALRKKEGARVSVNLQKDSPKGLESAELMTCLKEEGLAYERFKKQLRSHQNYFHRYVCTAKTPATRAGRILNVINAMNKGYDFGQMIRNLKSSKRG